jgi:hypothetical protein
MEPIHFRLGHDRGSLKISATSSSGRSVLASIGRNIIAARLLIVVALGLSAVPTSSQSPKQIVFVHITVVDVKTSKLEPDMTVLTRGGRISDVSRTVALRAPSDAEMIEGSGQYMIPLYGTCTSTLSVIRRLLKPSHN